MKTADHYNQCIEAMFGLRRFGIKLGLSMIQTVLDGLGNPHEQLNTIHIAGTNGKGSIASMLASILGRSGYTVGLYTSPHLVRFNERISINGRHITDADVVSAYEAVKLALKGPRELTFFEYSTAMAFYTFGRQKVDWAIIETGMGGRLDATNIIHPVLSIISNISLEHREYLGNTIAQIAFEKGGIIKENTPVITGAKQKSAISVLKDIAYKRSAPFHRMGEAFRVRRGQDNTFSYFGIHNTEIKHLRTGLQGNHQIDNAAIALASCELLSELAPNLRIDKIKDSIENSHWPGRLEIVSENPFILLDGAHNIAAARNLSQFLSKSFKTSRIILIVGILSDKPYKEMLKSMLSVCTKVILTCPKNDRGLPPETLYSVAKGFVGDATTIDNVGDALKYAMGLASEKDVICIAGSLYVVGEAKEHLEKKWLNKTLILVHFQFFIYLLLNLLYLRF